MVIGHIDSGHTLNDCDYVCIGESDQTYINNAINSFDEYGGEIVLLEGLYTLSGQILIERDNVKVRGVGLVILDRDSLNTGNGYGIKIDDVSNITIHSICVCNAAIYGIYIYESTDINLMNVKIYNCEKNCIYTLRSSNVYITGCTTNNSSEHSIYINSSNNASLQNIESCNNAQDGIRLYNSSDCCIGAGVNVHDNARYGISFGADCYNNIITGVSYSNNADGDLNGNTATNCIQYLVDGDSVVTTTKIKDLAVTTAKLADSSVTEAKLGASSVTEGKIGTSAVTTTKIKDLAVTVGKLADSSVTEGKIAAYAVTATKIKDLAVTTTKLADKSVTMAKFSDDVSFSSVKYATFVVGTTTNGHTADDCDYLCTGSSDQTVINQAISALPTMGGKIILLDGLYTLSGDITINNSRVSLEGFGVSTRINRSNGTGSAAGILVTSFYSEIRNLLIFNGVYGVYLKGSANTVSGVFCEDNNYGICSGALDGSSGSSLNLITGNYCAGSTYGIIVSDGAATITNNRCMGGSAGIYLAGGNQHCVVGNSCSTGIFSTVSNSTIVGNYTG